jgi:hypothetical protein
VVKKSPAFGICPSWHRNSHVFSKMYFISSSNSSASLKRRRLTRKVPSLRSSTTSLAGSSSVWVSTGLFMA